jgi:hypothetical protein
MNSPATQQADAKAQNDALKASYVPSTTELGKAKIEEIFDELQKRPETSAVIISAAYNTKEDGAVAGTQATYGPAGLAMNMLANHLVGLAKECGMGPMQVLGLIMQQASGGADESDDGVPSDADIAKLLEG